MGLFRKLFGKRPTKDTYKPVSECDMSRAKGGHEKIWERDQQVHGHVIVPEHKHIIQKTWKR